jgi:hypothetical protein
MPKSEELVENRSQRVDVSPGIEAGPFPAFRWHVNGSAEEIVSTWTLVAPDADGIETRDPDLAGEVEEQIARLDAAVDDAPPVQVG